MLHENHYYGFSFEDPLSKWKQRSLVLKNRSMCRFNEVETISQVPSRDCRATLAMTGMVTYEIASSLLLAMTLAKRRLLYEIFVNNKASRYIKPPVVYGDALLHNVFGKARC